MNYMGIKIEVDSGLPKNTIMLISRPPSEWIFNNYEEVVDYYIKHPERIVIATGINLKEER